MIFFTMKSLYYHWTSSTSRAFAFANLLHIIPSDCSPTTGLPVRQSIRSVVRSQSVQKLMDWLDRLLATLNSRPILILPKAHCGRGARSAKYQLLGCCTCTRKRTDTGGKRGGILCWETQLERRFDSAKVR